MPRDDCPRCAELQERIAWLESELGERRSSDDMEAIRAGYRVIPCVAHFILALYAAKGRTVTHAQLEEAIPQVQGHERAPNFVRCVAFRARAGMGQGMVEAIWRSGYRLTPAGMASVAAIMAAQPTAVAA